MPTMSPQQRNAEFVIESHVHVLDEPEDEANRKRFFSIILFVVAFATVSLLVYLFLRPPNRHLEQTPYDGMIAQLRTNMSEQDVMALFRSFQESGQRGDLSTYDESVAGGARRVVVFKLLSDEPLAVKLQGRSVVEWCYRDHCHDNIE